jgi:hypothetical protein
MLVLPVELEVAERKLEREADSGARSQGPRDAAEDHDESCAATGTGSTVAADLPA